jgi:hypothetical protein
MDLEIHLAYFGTSQDYQGGRVYLLFLTGSDEDGEPAELRMSVGGDWTSADGGKTIVHPTKKRINKNSIYGHFIARAVELEDVVDGQTLRDVMFDRGNPLTADIWVGVKMHLDLVTISFGKNVDPQERLLPTKYLGLSTESAPLSTASPQAAPGFQPPVVPPTPTAPVAPPSLTPLELVQQAKAQAAPAANGSPLFQEMIQLAKASSSYQEFMAAAFARADVLADEELAVQVADEASGIWPLAQA